MKIGGKGWRKMFVVAEATMALVAWMAFTLPSAYASGTIKADEDILALSPPGDEAIRVEDRLEVFAPDGIFVARGQARPHQLEYRFGHRSRRDDAIVGRFVGVPDDSQFAAQARRQGVEPGSRQGGVRGRGEDGGQLHPAGDQRLERRSERAGEELISQCA